MREIVKLEDRQGFIKKVQKAFVDATSQGINAAENEIKNMKFTIGEVEVPIDFNLEKETKKAFEKEYKKLAGSSIKIKKDAEKNLSKLYDITIKPNVNYKLDSSYKKGVTEDQEKSIQSRLKKVSKANKDIAEKAYREQYELYNKINSLANELVDVDILKTNDIDEYIDYAKKLNQYASLTEEARKKLKTEDWKQYKVSAIPKDVINGDINNVVAKTDTGKIKRDLSQAFKEVNSYVDNGIESISDNANYKGIKFVDRFSDGIVSQVEDEQDKIVEHIKVLAKETAIKMLNAFDDTMDNNRALVKGEIVDINSIDKNMNEINSKIDKKAKDISTSLLERFEKLKVKIPIDANIVNSDITSLRPFIKSFESVMGNTDISNIVKSQLGDAFSEMEKYYNTFAQRVNETPSKSSGIKAIAQTESDINNLLEERNILENKRANSLEVISSVTREEKRNIEDVIQDSNELSSKLETVENKLDEVKNDLSSLSNENSFSDMLGSASEIVKTFSDKLDEIKNEVVAINKSFENTVVLLGTLSDKMNVFNDGINIKDGLNIGSQVEELKESLLKVEDVKSNIDKELSGTGSTINLETETNSFNYLRELLSDIHVLLYGKNDLLAEEVGLSEKVDSVENKVFKELREVILDVVDLLKYKNQYLEESAIHSNSIKDEVDKFEALSDKLKGINEYLNTLKSLGDIKVKKGASESIDGLSKELIKLSTSLEVISKSDINDVKIDDIVNMVYKLSLLNDKLSGAKELLQITTILKKALAQLNTIKSDRYVNTINNLASLSTSLSEFVFTDNMKAGLEKAGEAYSNFANTLNNIPPVDISTLKQVVQAYNVIAKANNIKVGTQSKESSKDNVDDSVKENLSALKKLESQLNTQSNKTVDYANDIGKDLEKTPRYIDELINKVKDLQKAYDNLDYKDPNIKNQIKAIDDEVDKLIPKVKKFQDSIKDKTGILATEKEVANLQRLYDKIFASSKLSQKYSVEKEMFGKIISSANKTKKEVDDITIALRKLESEANKAGNTGATAFEKWSNRMVSLASYLTTFASFYDIINMFREGLSVVRELDTSLTEMRKVSNESLASLQAYQASTFDRAEKIGTTAYQLSNSTADWMRLGEDLKKASESADVSNILLNVSEFENIDDATQSLVSMSQAFKDIDKLDIVNKLNVIGNNFSISTDQLASSLQRSAAALVTAGNDIDEAMALTVAGNAVTQDAQSVGAGLRTISLRIMGTEEAKEELASLGEDTEDYVVQTKSKLQELVKDYTAVASNGFKGFDILKDNGEYKSTYEILLGISEIYKEILETDSKAGTNRGRALLEALAGKNRANIAASILQNPELLKQAYDSANKDYVDSAQKELDNYLDSVNGKITQIQSRAQEVAYNALDSESLKTILDNVLAITDGLAKVSKYLFSFPAILGTISGILSKMTGIGIFQGEGTGKDIFTNPFSQIMQGLRSPALSKDEMTKLKDLHLTMQQYGKDSIEVQKAMNGLDDKLVSIANTSEFASKGIEGVNVKSKIATMGVNLLKMALEGLAVAAITIGIQLIAKEIDKLIVTSEEAKDAVNELTNAYDTINSSSSSNLQTIESVKDRYYELSEGVNELGNNVSLTTDEYEEYKGIISQISETMPNLTARYNEQGEKVGFLTGQIKDLNKELAEQEQLEYSKLLANGEDGQGENIDTILKGIAKDYNDTKSNVIYNNPISNLFKSAKNFIAGKGFQNDPYLSDDGGMTKKIQETRDEIDKLEQSVKNLEETGVPKIVNGDALTDDSTTNLQKQQEEIKKYNAELVTTRANLQKLYAQRQVDAQALSNLGKLYSKTNKEYVKLDEDQKSYIDSVLSNISPEEVDNLIEKAKDAGVTLDAYMSSYANKIVELFSDNKNGVNSLMDKLLNFDFSDMSDAEIQQKVNELLSRISEILGINSNELKIRLGFEFVDENARDAELHMRQIATNNNGMVDEVSLSNMHKWADELNLTNEQLEHIEKSGYKASDGFEELKKAVKKADKEIERFNKNKIDIHIDTVDKAKTDLGTLTDSYADYKDGGGTVDVNKLNSVSDNMKNINGSTEAYQKFLDVLTEVPEDTAKVQEAYNELVTAYIDGQDVLQNLTVANLEYTTSELEKMGVTNAEEVAMSRLAQSAETTADKTAILQYAVDNLADATDRAKYANIDFANSDVDTIISLAKEEGISGSLRKSLVALAFQKMSVNNVSILTTGDINNMIAMAKQAGIAVNALERLANAKSALNGNSKASKNLKTKSITANYNAQQGMEAEARKSAEQAQHEADRISNGDVGDTANYGGGGNTTNSKTGSSKNTSPKKTKTKKTKKTKKSMSLTKTLYNWIERKLDVVAKKADRAQEKIDRLLDWDKKRNATLKALEAVEKQLDENYKASKRYYSYAKSQAKAEMKDAVAQVKKEGSKAQKKKYGKNLSQKTMDKYMKLVEEGKIGGEDIQAIKDPRIKAFVDAYIEWYEKAKAVDDTINSLTDDVRDLYEQLANNPLDKCAEQVEKLGNAMTVLEGKSTNAIYKMNTAFVNMAKSVTKSTDLIGKTYYDMGTTLSDVIPNEVFDTIIENRDEKYKNLIATLNEYAIAAGNAMSNSASSVKKFETSQKQVLDLFSGKSAKDLGVTDEVLKSMKEQVANGELIDPDLITLFNKNTEVQNALKKYLNAYIENEAMQKALEKATSDYEIKNQEITTDIINNNLEALTKTDNYLQHQLDLFNAQESALAGQVALMEQYGKVYDRANYDKQIEIEQREYDAIIKARNQQMALLATIPEGTDQWYEARDLINAYNDKLLECEGNMYSLKEAANSIVDSLYEMYEVLNTRINNELQFFIDMMEEVEDFDPVTHMATDEGLARLYLYSAQMGNINSLIDQDKKKIIEYNEAIAKAEADGSERIKATIMGSVVDWTLSDAKDKVDEAYDSLMDHEKEFHALKNNMIEWEISKLEEELNLAQEIVDARKDALTAEKNLHDYQRSIQDATQNINNLQKQITVVRGDTSQEGKARVQALQKQLRDAQKNLEETEYERYISAEQEMLDNLMEEYTTLVDEEKTHREELYERAKLDIITNADKITSTIDTAVGELGVTPQYTSDVTTWLKDNKVTELSSSLTTAIDSQRQSIIKALTGNEKYDGNSSVFGSINGLSGKFDAFTTYKTDVDSTFKSLNTTMTSLQNKTFTAIVDTDTITNKIIAEIAKSKVVASNDEVIDVTANPEDPTNGGGTGSGGGNIGNNGSGKIFTNSTETPNSLSDGKVNSTNGTHLPTQSAKTPEEVFNQIQDQSDFEKRKKASEVATFLKNLTDSEGQTLVQNDGAPKSNMNKFVYNYTQDANGKGLILKKAGYTKLYEMLGIPDSSENKADEAYKALLELGFHAPDMSELDSVNAVTRFMASNKHGHGLKKKYEKYGAVNQLLYSAYNKVLDDADLKELSLVLGKKYTDSSFNGWLFNAIWNRVKVLIPKFKNMTPRFDKNKKQLYFSGSSGIVDTGGFAKGGIVDYVHGQGEDGIAMVRQGEGILTPAQTKTFMYELAPRLDDIIDASKLIKDTTANLDKVVPMGETNVEATFQFDLENVTNAGDIIKQIQTNNNVQKAIQSVTIDRIAGGSRLGVNKF